MRIGGLSRWASVVLLGLVVLASSGLGSGGQPPVADFSWEFLTETVVQFHDESYDPDGQIVAWKWDFGDGYTSTQQNPAHAYEQKGIYTVTLTVTDDDGLSDTVSKEIAVYGWRVPSDYASIQEAIDAVPEGTTIQIEAGTYKENLGITKPVTLVGASAGKTVIEAASRWGFMITIRSDQPIEVRLAGVTVTGGLGGLVVRGRAQVTVEDSTISGNGDYGLRVWGSARVTVEDSTVSGNGCGLRVLSSARVTVENCTISGNGDCGLDVSGSARVTVEDSTISGNGFDGLRVDDSARVAITGSQISNNGNGLYVKDQAQVVVIVKNSTVSGNRYYGLRVLSSDRVTVENCTISGNGDDGLRVLSSDQVTVENSTISGNGFNGLCVSTSDWVTVENCTVFGNSVGLRVSYDAWVELNGSWVSDNKVGISREDSATITGRDNWVRYNIEDFENFTPPEGFLRDTSPEPISDETEVCPSCEFTDVMEAVIHTKPGGTVRIQAGEYHGGIVIVKDLTLVGEGCDQTRITGSWGYGIRIRGQAVVAIQDLAISGNGGDGLSVWHKAHVELTDTTIRNNTGWGIAAALRKCGYRWDDFTGTVLWQGRGNTITGNGKGDVCLPGVCIPEGACD